MSSAEKHLLGASPLTTPAKGLAPWRSYFFFKRTSQFPDYLPSLRKTDSQRASPLIGWPARLTRKVRRGGSAPILLAATLLLSACGFQPLYGRGEGQVAAETLRQVRINPIADRSGQILRGLLSDRVQPKGLERARYSLDINLAEGVSEVAVRRDATSSYSRLRLNGGLVLTDLETRQVVLSEPVRSEIGYINQEGGYGTLLAQNKARELAVQDLANSISLRLSAFLAQRGQAKP
jgi:LPS-assembly lipoprotein